MMQRILITLALVLSSAIAHAQTTDSSNYTRNSAQTLIDSKGGNLLMAAYGEGHYNQGFMNNLYENGTMDIHRLVLLFGYKFDKKTSFITEIELEHIQEVYLEQAFLNYQAKNWLNFQAGLVLVPMGIVNEYHEPNTFNGVERPTIDQVLVPSTWREIAAGFTGNVTNSSLRYQVFAMNGPAGYDDGKANLRGAQPIRSARQKGSEVIMGSPDLSAKLNYYGIRGLNIGLAGYFGTTESTLFNSIPKDSIGLKRQADSSVVGIRMVGLDYRYSKKNFESRAQLILAQFNNSNSYNAFTGQDLGSNAFGYYVEAGYNVSKLFRMKKKLVPFIRYSKYDTHYKVASEMNRNLTYQSEIWTGGLSLHLNNSSVVKLDYQRSTNGLNASRNVLNAGVGFWFR